MGVLRESYSRFRHLIHEGAKFLVVGGVGTVVTFGVANALHRFGEYKAVTIATIIATIVTFLGNRHWTFRHRQGDGTARETLMFFIMNGIGLLIYYGCIWVEKALAPPHDLLWYNAALVIGTGLGTLFRFWSYRKWVWGKEPAGYAASTVDADLNGPEQERLAPASIAVAAEPPAAPLHTHAFNGGRPAANGARPGTDGTRPSGHGGRHAGAHRRH